MKTVKKTTAKKTTAKKKKTKAKKKTAKKKDGRPTKFSKDYCQSLIDHMGSGYSFESFAGLIGVSRATIYNWVERPDFLDAKNIAFEKSRLFWERIGLEGTQGQIEKWNPTGWIFNMKNRFDWKDKREDKHEHFVSPHQYLLDMIEKTDSD